MISVKLLGYNEKKDFPTSLDSLTSCDDIYVIDQGNTDNIAGIAKSYGGHHAFNFRKQRNFEIDNITLKYPWVLLIITDKKLKSTEKIRDNVIAFLRSKLDKLQACFKQVNLHQFDFYPMPKKRISGNFNYLDISNILFSSHMVDNGLISSTEVLLTWQKDLPNSLNINSMINPINLFHEIKSIN